MKNIIMTYCPSIREIGDTINLQKYDEYIRTGFVQTQISRIREAATRGDQALYDKFKRSLPAVIVAAVFEGCRKKEGFRCGLCRVVLDIDHLSGDELTDLQHRLASDPQVMYFNVSPGGSGLKIFVSFRTHSGEVPADFESYEALHHVAYDYIVRLFTQRYGHKIDTSGRDPMRICFLSHDPEAHYNPQYEPVEVPEVEPATTQPATQTAAKANTEKPKTPKKTKEKKSEGVSLFTGNDSISLDRRRLLMYITFHNLYRHKHRYREGNRHKFLLMTAFKFNEYGIPRNETEQLLLESLPQIQKFEPDAVLKDGNEIRQLVEDVFTKEKEKFGSKRIKSQLRNMIYMKIEIARLYVLRRNLLSEKIEYIEREKYEQGDRSFRELTDLCVTDIYMASKEMQLKMQPGEVRTIFESSFSTPYDPLRGYMDECPEWDEHDHIAEFADSIPTNAPDRFRKVLTMWYVGMVQSAMHRKIVNHIMIVLYTGSQGEGKTITLSNILPPELEQHMFIPKQSQLLKEDFVSYLAHKLVILVDEVQKLNREQLDSLETDITIPAVDFRNPYGHFAHNHPHVASFVGTCNSTKFMSSEHGNRRYHVFEVQKFKPFMPNHRQIFAQIKHLIDTNYKYYFTPDEQDELAAYAHGFENNDQEYEMVLKYIRMYPEGVEYVEKHKASDILQSLSFFNKKLDQDKSAVMRLSKALKRKKIPCDTKHSGSMFICYILTAEQMGYIEQVRDETKVLDLNYDKYLPVEMLVAHREATIRDLHNAKTFITQTKGDIEKAKLLYSDYLSSDDRNFSTKDIFSLF